MAWLFAHPAFGQPDAIVIPDELEFGEVEVSSSGQRSFAVSNQGADSAFVSVVSSNSAFTIVTSPDTLAPGATAAVTVQFAPASSGSAVATITVITTSVVDTDPTVTASGTAVTPRQIGADATTITFDTLNVGESTSRAVVINNIGTATQSQLSVPSIQVSGNSDQFSYTLPGSFTLPGGASRAIEVTFAPTSPGLHTLIFTINHNSNAGSTAALSITMVGEAVAVASLGGNAPSSASLDFDQVSVGTRSSPLQGSVFSNDNTTRFLEVWTTSDEFVVTLDDSTRLESTTPQFVDFRFDVAFTPAARGVRTANLLIRSNAATEPIRSWSLTGTGVAPQASVTASNLAFGDVRISGSATPQTVSVTNLSQASGTTLQVTVELQSEHFTADVESLAVPPNETRSIEVTFAPVTLGSKSASLTIRPTNDPDGGISSVALSGVGVSPVVELSHLDAGNTLGFGGVRRIDGDSTRSFVVRNIGSQDASITGWETNNGAFAATVEAGAVVTPGDSALISVTFSPPTLGLHEGHLVLIGDLGQLGAVDSLVVFLSGLGTSPRLSLFPTSHTFRTVTIPNRDTVEVVALNAGDEDLEVEWDSSSAPFEVTAGNARLGPGEAVEIEVIFRPDEPTLLTSALQVRSNDPAARKASVALRGSGVQTNLSINDGEDVDFGDVLVGGSSESFLRVRNLGGTDVQVSVDELDGIFRVLGGGLSIGAGGSEDIRIEFVPDARRAFNEILQIRGQNEELFSATLLGVGVEPEISLPSSEQFQAPVRKSERDTLSVVVRNIGSASLNIDGIVLDELTEGVDAFDRLTGPPIDLAPGASAEIEIGFKPPDSGTFAASLIVESDDRNSPADTVRISGVGKSPALQILPAVVDFGRIRHHGLAGGGREGTRELSIANVGTDTLFVRGLMVGNVTQFSVDDLNADIPPNGEVAVLAHFHPTTGAEHRTTLTLDVERPSEQLRWSGEFVGTGIRPKLNANLGQVTFDETKVNLGADTRELTLSNTGTDTLRIIDVVVENADHFDTVSISADLPVDLAPRDTSGDQLLVSLNFTPTHPDLGSVSATTLLYETRLLVVSDDVDSTTIAIDLVGVGSVSGVTLVDSILAFGRVRVGQADTLSLRVANEGDQALLHATFTNAQFRVAGDALFEVPQGGRTVGIVFAPTTRTDNTESSTLTLVDTTTGRPYQVRLTATGIQGAVAAASRTLDFGDARLNVPTQQSIDLVNTGNDTLSVGVRITGPDRTAAAQFVSFDTVSLGIGETQTIPVTFTPTIEEPATALLTVTPLDQAISAPGPVSLSGRGVAPHLALQSVDFGTVSLDSSLTRSLLVQNQGTDELTIYRIFVDSDFRHLFELSTTSQFGVAPTTTGVVDVSVTRADTTLLARTTVPLSVVHESTASPTVLDTTTIDLRLAVVDRVSPELAFSSTFQTFTPPMTRAPGSSATVEAYVRDNSGQIVAAETALWWRRGGDVTYTAPVPLSLTTGPGGIRRGTATIDISPDAASRGIEYFLRTVDASGNSALLDAGGLRSGIDAAAAMPFSLQVPVGELEGLVVEERPRTYHMVSVPMAPDEGDVFEVVRRVLGRAAPITKSDPKAWRLYHNDGSGRLVELRPRRDSAVFGPGSAYWLIADRQISMSSGPGSSTRTVPAFDTTLTAGWHLIGHPYDYRVAWADVEADGSPLSNGRGGNLRFWEYGTEFGSGKGGWSVNAQGLRPWRGYAVFAARRTTLTIHPRVLQGAGKPVGGETAPSAWRVQMMVTGASTADPENFLGMSRSASEGWDGMDDVEPPAVGDYVQAYFVPTDSVVSLAAKLSADMRPSSDGATWLLNVESNLPASDLTIEVGDLEDLPEELALHIFDLDAGIDQDLRIRGQYVFRAEGPRRFAVVAGEDGYVESALADLRPSTSGLGAIYPNPFNSAVAIRYHLAQSVSVRLDVFNVSGQRVRRLATGPMRPGFHHIAWDGRDALGREAATGTYFIRLQAGNGAWTQKVLLVR